jgi:hypothetical protein
MKSGWLSWLKLLAGGGLLGAVLGLLIGRLWAVSEPLPVLPGAIAAASFGAVWGALLGLLLGWQHKARPKVWLRSLAWGGYLGGLLPGLLRFPDLYLLSDRPSILVSETFWKTGIGALVGVTVACYYVSFFQGRLQAVLGGGITGFIGGAVLASREHRGGPYSLSLNEEIAILGGLGAIGGALLGLILSVAWSRWARTDEPLCSRCGRRPATRTGEAPKDLCSLCALCLRFNGLPEEERDAIRRLIRSGPRSEAIQEAARLLGVSANDAAFVVEDLKVRANS